MRIPSFLLLLGITLLGLSACEEDEPSSTTTSISSLRLSTDSVSFDTVFTVVGSATEVFKVFNTSDENLEIKSIKLAGGAASPYRINIDGESGTEFSGIKLLPKDSIWGFVEVTIDPNDQNNPFVVKDSIAFETSNGRKEVKLVSWGQNAQYLVNHIFEESGTLLNDRPLVLLGNTIIAPNVSITIPPNTRIHSHPFSRLFVFGTLKAEGTLEEPIIFEGDRLDKAYEDRAGQWVGIRFLPRSTNNVLKHCVIKNGLIGVEADSLPINENPNLVMEKVAIQNMSIACLLGFSSTIQATNCLFANSCSYLFAGSLGGDYDFKYCTFAGYNLSCSRNTASVLLTNEDFDDGERKVPFDLKARFNSCIIYGAQQEEIEFVDRGQGAFDPDFKNCLVKGGVGGYGSGGNVFNQEPFLKNIANFNYALTAQSAAIGMGDPSLGIADDLEGNFRDVEPDAGALEFKEE